MSFGTELAWSGAWWCSIIFPSSSYLTPSFPARPSGNTKPGGNVVLPHPGWNVNLNPQKHRIEDDHGHHEVADKRWEHKSLADTASDALGKSWQVMAWPIPTAWSWDVSSRHWPFFIHQKSWNVSVGLNINHLHDADTVPGREKKTPKKQIIFKKIFAYLS